MRTITWSLLDFGLAYVFSNGDKTHSSLGTPWYYPPQVFADTPYSSKTDADSFGMHHAVGALRIGKLLKACLSCIVFMQLFQVPSDREAPLRNFTANNLNHFDLCLNTVDAYAGSARTIQALS